MTQLIQKSAQIITLDGQSICISSLWFKTDRECVDVIDLKTWFVLELRIKFFENNF